MKTSTDEESFLHRGGKPTLADLLNELEFSPATGIINLNGARMVLARATFGADLQDELIRRFGEREAMILMLRLGYRNGREDAEFIRQSWPNLDIGDAFTAGTRLHMVTGTVKVETVHNDFDFKTDRFSGDFLWHQSVEATEYQRRHGRAMNPVCWAQTGYAAGYASVFFRKLVLYKEVSCAAMGDKSCRVVGKTVDDWGKDDPFVRLFLDEVLANRAQSTTHTRSSALTRARADQGVLEDMIVEPVRRELEQLARAGLSTLITGPDGAGCYRAASWLHAARFSSGQLHRIHGGSPELPSLLQNLRQTLGQKGARDQTLVIESFESVSKSVQLDLIDLLRTEGAAPENCLVIGVSHLPMADLQRGGALRAELLHALSVLPVRMPALAAREDDISLLGDIYLSHLTTRQTDLEGNLTPEARAYIRAQTWPGNLPELRAAILRAAMTAPDPRAITAQDMQAAAALGQDTNRGHAAPDLEAGLSSVDMAELWRSLLPALDAGTPLDTIVQALEDHALSEANGNISAAARRLGLTRAKLDYRLKTRA